VIAKFLMKGSVITFIPNFRWLLSCMLTIGSRFVESFSHQHLHHLRIGYNNNAWDRPILLVIAVIRYNRQG